MSKMIPSSYNFEHQTFTRDITKHRVERDGTLFAGKLRLRAGELPSVGAGHLV